MKKTLVVAASVLVLVCAGPVMAQMAPMRNHAASPSAGPSNAWKREQNIRAKIYQARKNGTLPKAEAMRALNQLNLIDQQTKAKEKGDHGRMSATDMQALDHELDQLVHELHWDGQSL